MTMFNPCSPCCTSEFNCPSCSRNLPDNLYISFTLTNKFDEIVPPCSYPESGTFILSKLNNSINCSGEWSGGYVMSSYFNDAICPDACPGIGSGSYKTCLIHWEFCCNTQGQGDPTLFLTSEERCDDYAIPTGFFSGMPSGISSYIGGCSIGSGLYISNCDPLYLTGSFTDFLCQRCMCCNDSFGITWLDVNFTLTE